MSKGSRSPRAVILSCQGPVLEADEKAFFAEYNPLGFILFGSHCRDPEQLRALTAALRDCVDRPDAPILIDQEGGRVLRLQPSSSTAWRSIPAAAIFGRLYEKSPHRAEEAVSINSRLLAAELADLGIDVNCAPLLDLDYPGASDIIGDRAFSRDPAIVARLGRIMMEGMMAQGVIPVIKHLPGHGRALVDSHKRLPVVDASHNDLDGSDFIPFKDLADAPWGMTAHILYTAYDADQPATISPEIVTGVIRNHIGFDGVLITDDLAMAALEGGLDQRARQSMAAGCDIVLFCKGSLVENRLVAESVPVVSPTTRERLARARAALSLPSQSREALQEQWRSLETVLSTNNPT